MADYSVSFTTKAWNDLENIANVHMQKAGTASAEKITDQILERIEKPEKHPFIGSIHTDEILAKYQYRKLVCGNYICIYRVDDKTIYIYRIVYGDTDYTKWLHP